MPQEQQYLEYINYARSNPPNEGYLLATTTDANVLNAYSTYGVNLTMMQSEFNAISPAPPLAPNSMLMSAARGHSAWMLANATQAHDESPTNTPYTRMTAAGYPWTSAGENIYAYALDLWYGHAGFEVDWDSGVTDGMLPGRGHRANIQNPTYTEIGLGYLYGTNTSVTPPVGPSLITEDFATENSPPTLGTGVAYYDLNGNGSYDVGEEISGLTVNVSGASYYCTTAAGGGWVVPVPSGAATRTVTFTGLGMNQSVPITFTGSANAKADLKLTYTPPAITSSATAYTNTLHTYSFNLTGGAGSYIWNRWTTSAALAEPCEATTNITTSTTGTYSVICTALKEQGSSSFQLVTPTAASQFIQLNPLYYVPSGSTTSSITFYSRVGWVYNTEYCKVQVMPLGGAWSDVYSVAGTNTGGDGYTFNQRTVSLTSMAGKAFQIRFLLYYTPGGGYYNDTSSVSGWLIDNITFSNVSALGGNATQTLTTSPGTYTPATPGTYITSITPVVSGNNYLASYQTLAVTTATAPAITTQPQASTIATGSTATLTVAASGSEPAYQWYVGSSGVTTNPVTGATSASFTTPTLSSTTTYWAKASNGAGSANSNAATVTVMPAPSITTQPSSARINTGNTSTLTVSAAGSSLTYQWYIGSTGVITSPISGATSSSYTTPALTTTTNYWVLVSNSAGTASSNTATITVNPTYASWSASIETTCNLPAGTISSNPNVDYNHDGCVNLIEYAFGNSPVVPHGHTPGMPVIQKSGSYVVMTYQRDTSLTDITVTPQVSHTVGGTWYAPGDSGAPAGFSDNLISTNGTVQTRQAQVPTSMGTKIFMRIKVTKP